MQLYSPEWRERCYAAHDTMTQIVKVRCMGCDAVEKRDCPHSLSDHEIQRKYFPEWDVKGANAERTMCPKCKNGVRLCNQ